MRLPTERHPSDGTLRRLVDEPAGVADADRAHVAGCDTCLRGLAAARADATAVGTALAFDASPDVDLAWRRFSAAAAPTVPAPAPVRATPSRGRRRRLGLRSPLVAAVGAVVILGGAGVAAAANWLPIFHTEHVTTVQVQPSDFVALPDLSSYGNVTIASDPHVHQVDGPAAASRDSGMPVPTVRQLPAGVTGDPTYTVGGQLVAEFTFSAAKAQQAAATGTSLPPVPPGLDGATFRLVAGPGVAETWSEARGVPALVVARVTAPTAYSSSAVRFETARDYLLSLPGLPADLATQLRDFTADGSTLPIPVPARLVDTSTADVHGHRATVLASHDGAFTGVVWVQNGVVTGVAGSLSQDEVLSVARGLR